MSGSIAVLTAPLFDAIAERQLSSAPAGTRLSEIVKTALPFADPASLRVTLCKDGAVAGIAPVHWHSIFPSPGTQVVIRSIPGQDQLRSVLLAVVSVAALALAPAIAGTFGIVSAFGINLVTAGLTIVGGLLVNALIPVQVADNGSQAQVYNIGGWRNDLRPGAPVPMILGRHRYAPPFAATSWTEIVGDDQYVRAVFCFGYGPLSITDLRIGETSIDDFTDIDVEVREGRDGDAPLSLYPNQVHEEASGVELVRPLPRDAAGEIIPEAAAVETPVLRFTASDTAEIAVLLGFPGGLFHIDDDGDLRSQTVTIRIRARLNGVGAWTDIATLPISAKRREAFSRSHRWEPATRGRWQIEITRMTDEATSQQVSDNTVLSAIQSMRPEYPINMSKNLALVAIRVRATYQLNGALDSFNALVENEALVHDNGAWEPGLTRNPASAYLAALMGPANPYPVLAAQIDIDQIADWHDWCETKGLHYDRVHDRAESLGEVLSAICSAGRASPRHDGLRWGVVIDRPEALVIDHINPRNSAGFSWSRTYFEPPHAFRVRFLDETNDFQEAERIIRWPGYAGPITLTEGLELPGKTSPDEVWIEARRRMYELIHRPDQFSAMQDGVARVVTRGDLVMGSFDVLDRAQYAARVKWVSETLIEVDERISEASNLGIRFGVFADENDTIGTSLVRPIADLVSDTHALQVLGTGPMPAIGDLIHIGPISAQSTAMRVRGVEAADNFAARLIMVAAAPQIDTLTDAEVPPAWDGRVGEVAVIGAAVPAAPIFVEVSTGSAGTGDIDGLFVRLAPGAGSTAVLANYRVGHRLSGGLWSSVTYPVAEAGIVIGSYTSGDDIELRARSIATDTTVGPWTAALSVTIGANDPVPAALPAGPISVTGSLGHTDIAFDTSADAATAKVQIYRAPTGVALNRAAHALGAPIATAASNSYAHIDGDGSRTNLFSDGGFDNPGAWTQGAQWTVSGSVANHVSGAADSTITQAKALTVGAYYRLSTVVSNRTGGAGNSTLGLYGGTPVLRADFSATGPFSARLQATAGNNAAGIGASDTQTADHDYAVIFEETAGCIDADIYDYWLEPQTSAGLPGPVAGPFTTTVL